MATSPSDSEQYSENIPGGENADIKPKSDQEPGNSQTHSVPPPIALPLNQPPPDVVLWVETKTDSGKSYFYHSVTRETTWTKPEGPGVKIVSQAELQQHQMPPAVVAAAVPIDPVRRLDAKPPVLIPNNPFGAPPPRFALPPPLGMPPPGFGTPAWIIPPAQPGNVLIDPAIVAKASEWTEHTAPDGRTFYYNASKAASVWEKPEAIRELEAARMAAVQAAAAPPLIPHHPPAMLPAPLGPVPVMPPGGWIHHVMAAEAQINKRLEVERKGHEERFRAAQQQAADLAKPVDKSKPISSTPISGTPWCVVWTGDGRVFFYNPSTKTSVWEKPEELNERADVAKAMSTVPEQLLATNPGNVVPTSRQFNTAPPIAATSGKSDSEEDPEADGAGDEIPNKKQKIESEDAAKQQLQNLSSLNAAEAELQASKERAQVPLEQRVTMFKEMLKEKDVSAFSTWDKELHKIVFDPRYLLLTSRERKQIFEKYVKDRAEEERKEKRSKLKQKVTDFRELMESASLNGKSTFSEFAQKYAKDERLRAIEKMRERESLFNEFMIEVRKREKECAQLKKEQAKKDFIQMLKDHPHVDRHSRWGEVRKMLEGKSAFRAVDSGDREELFNEFKAMKKERRKSENDKRRTSESSGGDDDHPEDEQEDQEEILQRQKERERQLRAEASIKEREKEVQRTLAGHLRERDSKREHHKKGEAIGHFNALLTDLVRNSDLSWKEVKRQLRKDHRYPLIESLEREELERLFNEHVHLLEKKKRDKFRQLLDEMSIELTSSWKDVKRLIRDDPRYMKYNSSEKCEREFREYLKDKTIESKTAFRELLHECKLISHKSLEQLQENATHMREIIEYLKNDKRFLDLEHIAMERQEIIHGHLQELAKRGPPPPPTAATATRRKT